MNFFKIFLLSAFAAALSIRQFKSTETYHIDQNAYDFFLKFARLTNIAYCVGPLTAIFKPFTCGLQCAHFPNMELIRTFRDPAIVFDASGYLAVDHGAKEIYLVTRGTHSIEDVLTDFQVIQAPLTNMDLAVNITAGDTCKDCRVHSGFLRAYNYTYNQISDTLNSVIKKYPDYKMVVAGHSFGGATALLFAVNLKVNGHDPLLVTLAQPIVGNRAFANWVDRLFFGQENPDVSKFSPDRNLYRVTHKGDLVAQVPFWAGYQHSSGEVFIDWPLVHPPLSKVVMCQGQSNSKCSAGNRLRDQIHLVSSHLQYFVLQGICGL
uniref:triacylglycerol lipase n=1 Tax=Yarrowia phangngaensis TaxID=444778 RepID=A0A078BRW1_9ASCO|nr:lipase [Yarrowia phangngaensis]